MTQPEKSSTRAAMFIWFGTGAAFGLAAVLLNAGIWSGLVTLAGLLVGLRLALCWVDR